MNPQDYYTEVECENYSIIQDWYEQQKIDEAVEYQDQE